MNRHIFVSGIALCFLCGCQATSGIYHAYPETWPELSRASAAQCPNISGTYTEKGACNYSLHCKSLSLSERLSSTKTNAIEEGTVTIKQPSTDQIELFFSTPEGFVKKQLSLKSDQFLCEDGAVWIKQGEYFQAEGVGVASRKYVMGFTKASDGSLIGQHRNSGWGLVMWVVPIGGTQILWYKWNPSN